MDNYFEDLYRFFTSDTIVPSVSQTSSIAGVKNVTAPMPTAPVKEEPTTEIETAIIEQPTVLQQQGTLDDDVNALAQHYGILQKGQTIEIGLRELLSICPRPKRPRTDAYNALIRKLREEYGVELVIVSKKSNNKTLNLKQDETS